MYHVCCSNFFLNKAYFCWHKQLKSPKWQTAKHLKIGKKNWFQLLESNTGGCCHGNVQQAVKKDSSDTAPSKYLLEMDLHILFHFIQLLFLNKLLLKFCVVTTMLLHYWTRKHAHANVKDMYNDWEKQIYNILRKSNWRMLWGRNKKDLG